MQPSYCPFAIWDTPLCKQLSTDRKNSRLFFFLFFFLRFYVVLASQSAAQNHAGQLLQSERNHFSRRWLRLQAFFHLYVRQTRFLELAADSPSEGLLLVCFILEFLPPRCTLSFSSFLITTMLEGIRRTRLQSRTKKQPPALLTFSYPPLFTAFPPPIGGRVNKQDIQKRIPGNGH